MIMISLKEKFESNKHQKKVPMWSKSNSGAKKKGADVVENQLRGQKKGADVVFNHIGTFF